MTRSIDLRKTKSRSRSRWRSQDAGGAAHAAACIAAGDCCLPFQLLWLRNDWHWYWYWRRGLGLRLGGRRLRTRSVSRRDWRVSVDSFEILCVMALRALGMRRCGTRKVCKTRGACGIWVGDGLCGHPLSSVSQSFSAIAHVSVRLSDSHGWRWLARLCRCLRETHPRCASLCSLTAVSNECRVGVGLNRRIDWCDMYDRCGKGALAAEGRSGCGGDICQERRDGLGGPYMDSVWHRMILADD